MFDASSTTSENKNPMYTSYRSKELGNPFGSLFVTFVLDSLLCIKE